MKIEMKINLIGRTRILTRRRGNLVGRKRRQVKGKTYHFRRRKHQVGGKRNKMGRVKASFCMTLEEIFSCWRFHSRLSIRESRYKGSLLNGEDSTLEQDGPDSLKHDAGFRQKS